MQHDSNAYRGGFTGVGALMDPGFLRDVNHPEELPNHDTHMTVRVWATAAAERTQAWLAAVFHRAG